MMMKNARLEKEIPRSSLTNDWIAMLETGELSDVTLFVGPQRTVRFCYFLVWKATYVMLCV